MKDELFTMVPDMPGVPPEVRARWQEEANLILAG